MKWTGMEHHMKKRLVTAFALGMTAVAALTGCSSSAFNENPDVIDVTNLDGVQGVMDVDNRSCSNDDLLRSQAANAYRLAIYAESWKASNPGMALKPLFIIGNDSIDTELNLNAGNTAEISEVARRMDDCYQILLTPNDEREGDFKVHMATIHSVTDGWNSLELATVASTRNDQWQVIYDSSEFKFTEDIKAAQEKKMLEFTGFKPAK